MTRQLADAEAVASERLLRIVREIQRDVVGALERAAKGNITPERLNQITLTVRSRLDDAFEASLLEMAPTLEKAAAQGAMSQSALARHLEADGLLSGPKYEEIARALRVFGEGERMQQVVGQTLGTLGDDLRLRFDTLTDAVQGKLAEGLATGKSAGEIARGMLTEAGQLNTEVFGAGAINDEAFADMLARTAINQVNNDISIDSAAELGLDRFVNLGVDDERQADECADASGRDAMTLAEWDATPEGPAPRHPNCRCLMVPTDA